MSNCGHHALPSHKLAPHQLLNSIPIRILHFQVQGGKYDSYGIKLRPHHNSSVGGVDIYHDEVHLHDLCSYLNR